MIPVVAGVAAKYGAAAGASYLGWEATKQFSPFGGSDSSPDPEPESDPDDMMVGIAVVLAAILVIGLVWGVTE